MTTAHKDRAVGMSAAFAVPYGELKAELDQTLRSAEQAAREVVSEARSATRQEPEFISTIKARSMIRAQLAKGRQQGLTQTHLAAGAFGAIPVMLVYSGGQWRASTQWGALVESHFCYTECVRRAELRGFTPMSAT